MVKNLLLLLFSICSSNLLFAQATACIPTFSSGCGSDYINGFVTTSGTTNINNNNSGCNSGANAYIDYGATHKHTGMPGGIVNFTIYNCPGWSLGFKIWVDWNDNGLFTDVGDLVYETTSTIPGGGSVMSSFPIPNGATPGIKRLRVRGVFATTTFTSCDAQTFGETEDYQLIVGSSNCTGTPVAGTLKSKLGDVLCGNMDSLYLEGMSIGQGITYTWQMQNGATWTSLGVDTFFKWSPAITQTRNFRVIVACTNTGGGSVISNVKTITKHDPVINLGHDTTICIGNTLHLSANLINATTYQWSNNQNTQTINVTNPGTYSVEVTQANGCKARDTIIVDAGVEPTNNIAPNLYMCVDSQMVINAGNPGMKYQWSNNAQTQSITVTNAGNYSVTVTSLDSCKRVINTNVSVNPRPTFPLLADTYNICILDSVLFDATSPVGHTFNWSTGDSLAAIYASDSGQYIITAYSDKGCPKTKSIQLNWFKNPELEGFSFIPKFYDQLKTVAFSPIGQSAVTSYHWDFGDGKSSNLPAPIHTYDSFGSYSVIVTVSNHCAQNVYTQVINLDQTGINSVSLKTSLSIYPNPSTGIFNIENTAGYKIKSIHVLDISGKLLHQKVINATQANLDLHYLNNGMYLLRIEDASGIFTNHKIEIIK